MNIILIAAVDKNLVIGYDNKMCWHLPRDMHYFKQVTLNHPVIMGRKSYEALPAVFKPLSKRYNIVLTRHHASIEGCQVAHNIEYACLLYTSDAADE